MSDTIKNSLRINTNQNATSIVPQNQNIDSNGNIQLPNDGKIPFRISTNYIWQKDGDDTVNYYPDRTGNTDRPIDFSDEGKNGDELISILPPGRTNVPVGSREIKIQIKDSDGNIIGSVITKQSDYNLIYTIPQTAVKMPNIVGIDLATAITELENRSIIPNDAGFEVIGFPEGSSYTNYTTEQQKLCNVTEQFPAQNVEVLATTQISITVDTTELFPISTGEVVGQLVGNRVYDIWEKLVRYQTQVYDVVNNEFAATPRSIIAQNSSLQIRDDNWDTDQRTISKQYPGATVKLTPGNSIKIGFTGGTNDDEFVIVPNVKGNEYEAAYDELRNSGFNMKYIADAGQSVIFDPNDPSNATNQYLKGTVEQQQPESNSSKKRKGTYVTLKFAVDPEVSKTYSLPNLVGSTLANQWFDSNDAAKFNFTYAITNINNAALDISYNDLIDPYNTTRDFIIIGQSQQQGSYEQNTTVKLTVTRQYKFEELVDERLSDVMDKWGDRLFFYRSEGRVSDIESFEFSPSKRIKRSIPMAEWINYKVSFNVPEGGDMVKNGDNVILGLIKESVNYPILEGQLEMPDLSCKTEEEARDILVDLGFENDQIQFFATFGATKITSQRPAPTTEGIYSRNQEIRLYANAEVDCSTGQIGNPTDPDAKIPNPGSGIGLLGPNRQ